MVENRDAPGHMISTMTCSKNTSDATSEFESMQTSLWITVATGLLSSIIFMVVIKYVDADHKMAEDHPYVEGNNSTTPCNREDGESN